MSTEAINIITAPCEGVSNTVTAPLKEHPANPTITVYSNGGREVGCAYLDINGQCKAISSIEDRQICIQLNPINSDVLQTASEDLNETGGLVKMSRKRGRPISLNIPVIKDVMDRKVISQHELATAIDRSQAFVSNLLNGNEEKHISRGGSVYAAYRLSRLFTLPYEEIISEPEDIEVVQAYEQRVKASQNKTE